MTNRDNKLIKFWHFIGSPTFLFFFIAIWVAIVLVSGIRFGDLSGYDDAAYAHEARVIFQTGNWWTLSLNGNPDFDKPPLFIWLITISFKIFGVTDFSAKIPGVVCGWATVILVYFLAKELFAEELENNQYEWLSVLSMFCLATTQYFLKYASHAMTDVPFTFFFTLAIYFYVRGLKNSAYLLASGVAIGLSMMIRSPIGFFPLGIIAFHLLCIRRFKLVFSPYFIGLIFLAIAIPAIWYLYEYQMFGEIFINRHFSNVAAHSASINQRTVWQQFLWYFEYFFLIIRHYFPWFPLMFYGFFLIGKKIWKDKSELSASLLLIWLAVVLIPFSLVESKVLRYILPAFPVFSILSAYSIFKLISVNNLQKISRFIVIVLFLAGIFIVGFPKFQIRGADMRTIAPISDAAANPAEKVILYTFGQYQWDYQNQLLWYGNRNTILIKEISELEKLLAEKKSLTVVMDKNTFDNFSKQSNFTTEILGSSEKFICFRLNSLEVK